MYKEALGKVGVVIEVNIPKWQQCVTKRLREELIDWMASRILHNLEELGYRKLPQDRPPLLSDEAMDKAYIIPDKTQTWPYHLRNSIAEAQREADIKFYEGD